MDIGANLKKLRLANNLSVRDLARKAGCSVAVVSKIELNQVSPTLRTFGKICEALNITTADFLRPPFELSGPPIIIPSDRATCPIVMKWGLAEMRRVIPDAQINHTALLFHFDPGGCTSVRYSLNTHTQLGFVLKGKVELHCEDSVLGIGTGEGIYYNAHYEHQWVNAADSTSELLVVNPYQFVLFEQRHENIRWQFHVKMETRRTKKLGKAGKSKPASGG